MPTGIYKRTKKRSWKLSENTKKKMSLSAVGKHIGNKSGMWKGNKASYVPIHIWVRRFFGATKKCEICGFESDNPRKIHWANKDHKYRRIRKYWMQLCVSCHRKYDIINNGYEIGFIKNGKKYNKIKE